MNGLPATPRFPTPPNSDVSSISRTIAQVFLGIATVGLLIACLSILGLGAGTIDPFGAAYELPYLPIWLWEGAFPSIELLGILGVTVVCTFFLYKRKFYTVGIAVVIVGFILAIPFIQKSLSLWQVTRSEGLAINLIPSGADLATFKRLSDSVYFVDANHAYCWGQGIRVIPGSDPSTAKVVAGNLAYGVVEPYNNNDVHLQVRVNGVLHNYDSGCSPIQ